MKVRRYPQLKIADEILDRKYRNLAEISYSRVKQILSIEADQQQTDFERYLDAGEDTDFEYSPLFLTKNESSDGYHVYAREIQVQENQYPLVFIFGTKEKIENPSLGWMNQGKENQKAVIIFNNLKDPYNLFYADTRLSKSGFIHEFIHYLDVGRSKEKKITLPQTKEYLPPSKWTPDKIMQYFNNPAEMNAYYQAEIGALEKIVDSLIKYYDEKIPQILGDFQSFYEYVIRFFPQNWVNALSPKNKRKVQKRLYHFYETQRDKK